MTTEEEEKRLGGKVTVKEESTSKAGKEKGKKK